MAAICICGHSGTDHLSGRCVNRRMWFDAAIGGTVAARCSCKKFGATVVAVAPETPDVEEAREPEPEEEAEIEPEEEEATEPVGTAPAELAPESRPATKTLDRRRRR